MRSVITSRRIVQAAAGTAVLTLGAWALTALTPLGQGQPSGALVASASLGSARSTMGHDAPAPQIWLSSLAVTAPAPFAAPTYTPEAVLPRVARPLPPLPPRDAATPVDTAVVAPDSATPTAAPDIAPVIAPVIAPDIAPDIAPAVAALAPTPDPQALANAHAPRRSLFPVARPPVAVVETAALAPDIAEPAAPVLGLAVSRTPQRRPETVTRLASLSMDAPSAPVVAAPRRDPLSVPPLNDAVARSDRCDSSLARAIPRRAGRAGDGAAVIGQLASASGSTRDNAIVSEVLSGNIPDFMRDLVPVTFTGDGANGQRTRVTICVMPDYLAVGSDRDFVRVPLGLPAAMRIAERFDMVLPTTRMVDAIYAQANVRLSPAPMEPGSQMASTGYFLRHNGTVEQQRRQSGGRLGQLVSGHKKDLVLTNRLDSNPGRVAIYGWHRRSGAPIQPLSTVHGAQYADYSHGIRLISRRAFVNGREVDLRDILADSRLAGLVSAEGTISNRQLLAALN